MREIKFRALNGDRKWVYGVPLFNKEDEQIAHILQDSGEYVCDAKTVGQFTGLLDSKGREIWEGSIVRYGQGILEVCFIDACFELYDTNGEYGLDLKQIYSVCEVIGNIFESPELLK